MVLLECSSCGVRGNDISMIFQEPMTSLNPVLSIGRQLGETLRLHQGLDHKSAQARAADMLNLVGISEPGRRLREYPHQMSGGMRQRVMIAMALACNPKLLIADEPTTALDVTIQAQILDLMAELKRRIGAAIVLITHDLGVVAEVAERVMVMYAGRKVEEAPAACFAPRGIPIPRACSARCRSSVPRSPALKPGSPRFRAPCPASSSASSAACLQAAARAPPSCAGKWRRR
jgi:ABC-type dipeptide/oligopeptide/nickel transport system ATPase component